MKKRIFTICVLLVITLQMLFQSACSVAKKEVPAAVPGEQSYQEKGVSITNKGNYFSVEIDYTSGLSRYDIGVNFAKCILKAVPNYEDLLDTYLGNNVTDYDRRTQFYRSDDMKPQLQQEYVQEIDGMISVFSGGTTNEFRDGKISKDEFYLYNLLPDVFRLTACSFVSAYGQRSETHNNILARNLDWFGGVTNQLPKIHSVVCMKFSDRKVYSVGFLGFMGVLTGINSSKVFGAIMDSRSNAAFTSIGKDSYTFDLRNVLENKTTLNDSVDYMKGQDRQYSVNHLICFGDSDKSVVLENNFSGRGTDSQRVQRAVRTDSSKLNKDITWGIDNAVGAVNSFILYGNTDNHTPNDFNTLRWDNMKEQLLAKGSTVTFDELKEVTSYYHGKAPGTFNESGDIYNKLTLQMFVYEPKTNHLEVYFRPKDSLENSLKPEFVNIPISN